MFEINKLHSTLKRNIMNIPQHYNVTVIWPRCAAATATTTIMCHCHDTVITGSHVAPKVGTFLPCPA